MDHKIAKTETINLPDHVILEHILPRLPIKSLIRFKPVCKTWYTTISTYEFGKSHLKLSSPKQQFLLVEGKLLRNRCCFLRSAAESKSNADETGFLECSYISKPRGTILGSCNGIICFRYNINRFTLWNPATRQCRKIVYPNDDIDFLCSCGFSYAVSIDDYKIVILFGSRVSNVFQVYVFSLRTGRWKRVDGTVEYENYFVSRSKSVFIDSVLYWCPQNASERIVSFDFDDEKLVMNGYMSWLQGYYSIDLVRIEGCLSCCCRSSVMGDGVFDVWMLKRHGDWDSWAMIYSVNFEGVPLFNLGEISSKCLVCHSDSDHVKLVTLTEDGKEVYEGVTNIDGDFDIPQPWIYVESLVSPFETANFDEGNLQ